MMRGSGLAKRHLRAEPIPPPACGVRRARAAMRGAQAPFARARPVPFARCDTVRDAAVTGAPAPFARRGARR